MTRFIPHTDMTAEQIVQCSCDARAILHIVDHAAWAIQNNDGPSDVLADSIGVAVRLALELLKPVHDALEARGGLKGGAS
mgnify:CR=1 FL=1